MGSLLPLNQSADQTQRLEYRDEQHRQVIAGGTSQGKITVWNMRSGTASRHIDFPYGTLNDLQFSPDERLLAIAGRDLGVFSLEAPAGLRILRSDNRNYGTVRFSADGRTLLTVNGKGTIETIDAQSGTTRLSICCSTIYGEIAFTPDGSAIAGAGHWPSLWNRNFGTLIARLSPRRESSTFRPIAFDRAHGAILMGSQNGQVYVWDLETKELVAVSPQQSAYVDTVAVLAGGDIAYAGFGKMLRLWDPRTGKTRSITAAQPTSNLIPSINGATILFGTSSGSIEFWDVMTGQRLRILKPGGYVRMPARAPTGPAMPVEVLNARRRIAVCANPNA